MHLINKVLRDSFCLVLGLLHTIFLGRVVTLVQKLSQVTYICVAATALDCLDVRICNLGVNFFI